MNKLLLVRFKLNIVLQNYVKNDWEEDADDSHDGHTVDEPGDPMDSVPKSHGPHSLLQPLLLLVDDGFDDHGASENERQIHEERETRPQSK